MAVTHFSKVLAQYPNPNINRSETQVYTLPYPVLAERWGSHMHFVWCGPVRAQNSMCKKKFEVVGGRADVPQDPAMAGGAAHSIQDYTRFLDKR